MNLNSGQDWDQVVIRKKPVSGGAAKSKEAVTDAIRKGAAVETVKKTGAPGSKTSTGKDAAKLDRETEELHHDRVPQELKRSIQQARMAKKLTQAQLGNLINEKPSVITEYENGKAIPNPQVLGKLSRVLGVQLSAKKK